MAGAAGPTGEDGSWHDYRHHGEQRILPVLGNRRLTTVTAPILGDWLVELAGTGQWAPKTRNNALKALDRLPQPRRRRRIPARQSRLVRPGPAA